ncbi:glycosyltransferase [Methanoplanus limicola]|nr:glycosyltransferase [Methanoplanus limicola]
MILTFIADARTIHTQRWVEYFAKNKDNEVHLITYDPAPENFIKENPEITEHIIPGKFNNLYLDFWPRHLKIQKLVTKINPDLIHAHFITKYGFHLPSGKKYPTVVSAWGDDILILPPQSRIIHQFTKKILNRVDLIYGVSHDINRHIIEDFRIPEDKIKYLPFGIDTKMFSPSENSGKFDEDHTVIFSNRGFYPVYDMPTLVEGFEKAYKINKNLRLYLKGDGPELPKIKDLVKTKNLSDAVNFLQRTEYSQVPVDLNKADIFVTTAVSDGTPVSLLETMSTETPVIATNIGGVPEWITDGENGILVPPKDPDALSRKILLLAGDKSLRNRLGKKARKTVLERGDWWKLMAEAESDYRTLIDKYNQ